MASNAVLDPFDLVNDEGAGPLLEDAAQPTLRPDPHTSKNSWNVSGLMSPLPARARPLRRVLPEQCVPFPASASPHGLSVRPPAGGTARI